MSEEQYVVPDGMLKAASNVIKTSHSWIPNPHGGIDRQCIKCGAIDFSSAGESLCSGIPPWRLEKLLEAAIRWQAENPRVPTPQQKLEMAFRGPLNDVHFLCAEWQRRMYLAPEPKAPEEIQDLLYSHTIGGYRPKGTQALDQIDGRIIEAYRRGQKAGRL